MGIAQISRKPPPAPPIPQFGQLGPLFFGRQKRRIARMTEKSIDDDDDGWNHDYDGDDDNIDEIDDKNDQKTHKYYAIWVKID